jgi:predicted nucleotidyltransferase
MIVHAERSIFKVLAYFDLFNYPVSLQEIRYFLDDHIEERKLKDILEQMVVDKCIYNFGEFYSVQNDASLVQRRLQGNKRAKDLLVKAYRVARFLFHFPYVRGIGISGSLSKNFADEDADIDFFIITAPNRLWIARTIMHLVKKLSFLAGKQDWLCMNYYIDETALEISEKNIFTATELITLLPAYGNGTITSFFEKNEWAASYYPNYSLKLKSIESRFFSSGVKDFFEKILNNRAGDRLDSYLMKLTSKRWQTKTQQHRTNKRGVRMGLSTGKHFSKPDPEFFQKKVLAMYHARLKEIARLYEYDY